MANRNLEIHLTPSLTPRTEQSSRFFQPEPSEEPHFSLNHNNYTKLGIEKSDCLQADTRMSTEMNSSSLQTSTMQSINFKRSFCLNSPKRSVPQTPLMLSLKAKELQEQNLMPKLEERLKSLENQNNVYRKSENIESESLFDFNAERYNSVIQEPDDNISFEGNEDMKIPQLMWCASCGAEVMTKVEYVNTDKTFWAAMGILLSGGFLGCFLIPYMTNSCKGVRVRCHKCERILR
ncbi:hypothetical protein SteCoe_32269 [Stentor coeruleus]|uniref:LITAF domain-containing protein n=1 Tax=Stentor coeruleus TaxID=5963 RepID=A0A1R2AZS7_9CILI|nr:hypothetical protein SteCoe_32269 [Stentor coeruleus]